MAAPAAGPPLKPDAIEKDAIAELDSIPLFMKTLPQDDVDNAPLAALQSLIYEGTQDEIAQNFKEQGNDYFKGKRYREALEFYKQGLDAKPMDNAIMEALLTNLAACNLELQNYGSVLKDCSKVLTKNPKSSKAYYRSALALMSLGRLEEALDCCKLCLSFDPQNTGVKSAQERALKLKAESDRKENLNQERIRKESAEKFALKAAFRERNLVILNKPGGSVNPVAPHLGSDDPSVLFFPVFFLYPEYATSDIISEFEETSNFSEHLQVMFPAQAPPPHWDTKGEYISGNLVVYAPTHRKRLLKIGKKMTLRDVFNSTKAKEGEALDGLEIKDGCLSFIVMPKGDVETKWVEEYKRTRSIEK